MVPVLPAVRCGDRRGCYHPGVFGEDKSEAGLTHSFPRDSETLFAWWEELARLDQWHHAALFAQAGLRRDPSNTQARIGLVWSLLHAGRSDEALQEAKRIPHHADTVLPFLIRAARAMASRSPEHLAELHGLVASEPTPLGLYLIALTAKEVGDEAASADAARRYLGTADSGDPDMRVIVAAEQATDGDPTGAVESVETARSRRASGRPEPAREVTAALLEHGQPDAAARFLAEGVHRTQQPVYGDLIPQCFPVRRLTAPNTVTILLLAAMVVPFLLGVSGVFLLGTFAFLIFFSVMATLLLAQFWRLPGLTRRSTWRLNRARNLHCQRTRRHFDAVPLLSFLGVWVLSFLFWLGERDTTAGQRYGALAIAAVPALVLGLALWVFRRRQPQKKGSPFDLQAISPQRCRCWAANWIAGHQWRDYIQDHLRELARHEELEAVLRVCPDTDKTWLHLPAEEFALGVRLPKEPEQQAPGGPYL